jgi:hypothetical protein
VLSVIGRLWTFLELAKAGEASIGTQQFAHALMNAEGRDTPVVVHADL